MGALLGDTLRYLMASTVVITVGLLIGYRPAGGVVGVLLAVFMLVAFCFAISWLWLILGLKLRTPNAVMGTSMMILFPLTFVSSVFARPETMPGWLEAFVNVNPVTILVEAVRSVMGGSPDAGGIVLVLAIAAVVTAVFAPLALRSFNRAG